MNKVLIGLLIVLAGYSAVKAMRPAGQSYGERHNEVIMYSLTTCGYCKLMAKNLKEEGIAFSERYIDTDPAAMNELTDKLARAGYEPRGFGTPIMDVHGYMLPDNPSMRSVKRRLS